MGLPILLADGFETVIQVILFLLFILGPAIGKAIFSGKQPDAPPQRPKKPEGQPNQGRVNQEIDEFLRRQAANQRNVVVENDDVILAEPVARPRGIATPLDEITPHHGETVADHVRAHLDSHQVDEHTKAFGRSVEAEVDEIEAHMHKIFDHDLGRIQKESEDRYQDSDERGTDSLVWEGAAGRNRRADEVREKRLQAMREMLQDPKSMHTAIILREILQRPDF